MLQDHKNYGYNNREIVNVSEKLKSKYYCETTHISEKNLRLACLYNRKARYR